MERIPGSQPKNLERKDISELAFLGTLIEGWEAFRDGDEPYKDRQDALAVIVRAEIHTMMKTGNPDYVSMARELSEDLELIETFTEDDPNFQDFCDERIETYKGYRLMYLDSQQQ